MKSRILSFSMVLDAWKKQLWVFAAGCLAFFAVYPLNGMLAIEQWTAYEDLSQESLQRIFALEYWGNESHGNGSLEWVMLAAIALAALSAINGFSYLHSRAKVDLYHSLPIRRETLFGQQVLVGLINYVIPSFFGVIFLMIVGAFRNVFTLRAFIGGIISMLFGLVIFLMAFAIAALAMLLTGRILVGCLGTAVLFGYAVPGILIQGWYVNHFFYTYCEDVLNSGPDVWRFISPIYLGFWSSEMIEKEEKWYLLLVMIAITAVVMAVCLFVYRKRPSEAAGRAMAFLKVGSVIQVILTVVGTLAGGMILQSTVGRRSDLWLLFGIVLGFLLTYALIQMIYEGNIRRVIAGRWKLLTAGILTMVIVSVFRFDLIGYDRYLPKQEELESVGLVSLDIIPNNGTPISLKDMADHMDLSCNDQMYQFLQEINAGAKRFAQETEYLMYDETGERNSHTIYVKYKLKNHAVKYRSYTVYFDEIRTELAKLYDNSRYMEQSNVIRQVDYQMVDEVRFGWGDYSDISLDQYMNEQKRQALVEALQQDMAELTYEVVSEKIPVGVLTCVVDLKDLGYENGWTRSTLEEELMGGASEEELFDIQMYIFPTYHRTLKILEEFGVLQNQSLEMENSEKIQKITVHAYNEETGMNDTEEYTSKEDIQKWLPRLVRNGLGTIWMDLESGRGATVEFREGGGSVECQILKE